MRTVFLCMTLIIFILTATIEFSYSDNNSKVYFHQKASESLDIKANKLPVINKNVFDTFYSYVGVIGEHDVKKEYDESIETAKKLLVYIESLEGTEIAPEIILQDDSSFEAFGNLLLARTYDRKKLCFNAIYHHSIARDITAIDSTYIAFPFMMVIDPEQDYVLYKYVKNHYMDLMIGFPPYLPTNCFTAKSYHVPFYKLIDPVDVD